MSPTSGGGRFIGVLNLQLKTVVIFLIKCQPPQRNHKKSQTRPKTCISFLRGHVEALLQLSILRTSTPSSTLIFCSMLFAKLKQNHSLNWSVFLTDICQLPQYVQHQHRKLLFTFLNVNVLNQITSIYHKKQLG